MRISKISGYKNNELPSGRKNNQPNYMTKTAPKATLRDTISFGIAITSLFCVNTQKTFAGNIESKTALTPASSISTQNTYYTSNDVSKNQLLILSPTSPIKTSTGVSYFLAGATGKPENSDCMVSTQSKRLSSEEIFKSLSQVETARKKITEIYNGPEQPGMAWLTKSVIQAERERAVAIKDYTDKYYKGKIKNVIIVGMGGNIGTMKLAATAVAKECKGNNLIIAKNGVTFHFLDTMEPSTIDTMKGLIEQSPDSTVMCLVSQSGTTFETISLNALLQNGKKLPSKNIIPMIGDKNSAIGSMAQKLGYNPLPNKMGNDLFNIPTWQQTGGRWTGNTAEPSVIIALGGGDPVKWFDGYQATIEDFIAKPLKDNPVEQSALLDVAYYNHGFKEFFTLVYGNKLSGIIHGLMQNVNESTPATKNLAGNKFGGGIFHYADLAPKFQHDTMAQITDSTETPIKIRILTVDNNKAHGMPINLNKLFPGGALPNALQQRAKGMQGLNPAELMDAMAASTGYDAWRLGRPVEFVQLPAINEETMATLLAEQYIRTMTWGTANQIDVTREMSFPGYKKVFKDITENPDKKTLKQGPAAIFQDLTTKNK